jgi:hypothetical protein
MRSHRLPIAVALLSLAAAAPARGGGEDGARSLERGSFLERAQGDLAGAERAYREAAAALRADDPARADALFRLGMLLFREGRAEEGLEPFRELRRCFPGRVDLIARAERQLGAWRRLDGARGGGELASPPEAARPEGRVLAVRGAAGLFAFAPPGGEAPPAVGEPVFVSRGGEIMAEALVVAVDGAIGAARVVPGGLGGGEVAIGDIVDAPAARPARGAPPEPVTPEAAERFLEALAVGEASAQAVFRPKPRADLPAAPTAAAGVAIEIRTLACDAAFAAALPFSFERLAPARPDPAAPAAPEGAVASARAGVAGPVARLGAADERALIDRARRGPDPEVLSGERGRCAILRSLVVTLEPGLRSEVALAAGAGASLAIGLRALPGARGPVDLEVDLTALDGAASPAAAPDADPRAASRVERIRGRVALDRARPAALLAGLRDPFAPPGGRGPARWLLVLLSLR